MERSWNLLRGKRPQQMARRHTSRVDAESLAESTSRWLMRHQSESRQHEEAIMHNRKKRPLKQDVPPSPRRLCLLGAGLCPCLRRLPRPPANGQARRNLHVRASAGRPASAALPLLRQGNRPEPDDQPVALSMETDQSPPTGPAAGYNPDPTRSPSSTPARFQS